MDLPTWLLFLLLFINLICSAFFSSSETAMLSLNRYRLRHLAKTGKYSAIVAEKLLEKPDELISVILLGNNLTHIFASAITTLLALRLGGDFALAIATGLLTFVILIFCEISPKTFAAKHSESIAFVTVHVLLILKKIWLPLTIVINNLSKFVLWIFGVNKLPIKLGLDVEQLKVVLQESESSIPDFVNKMTINLLELDSISVQEIMTPIQEVVGIDFKDSDEQILSILQNTPFNRLPLYEESLDKMIGFIHIRDTFNLSSNFSRQRLIEMAEESYYIPEQTTLSTQISQFQSKKKKMAIVLDEYGNIKGLLTLDDILEVVFGRYTSNIIADSIEEVEVQEDGSLIIQGNYSLHELSNHQNIMIEDTNETTINGFILEIFGDIPPPKTTIKYNDIIFEILESDKSSVISINIRKLNQQPTTENE